ncbi:hypothetical protein CDAR_320921 [Caerostris darwini]|uniref:Uncharacterized protein n=1 Tax=Caerostris darwini TaxID=1538125 RepID=A0AAV4WYY3_9ARAC|nr:hypothetical protein CDAR_320921 [Caerostris darwini]
MHLASIVYPPISLSGQSEINEETPVSAKFLQMKSIFHNEFQMPCPVVSMRVVLIVLHCYCVLEILKTLLGNSMHPVITIVIAQKEVRRQRALLLDTECM